MKPSAQMIKTVLLKIDPEIRSCIVQNLKEHFPQINVCGTTFCCEEASKLIVDHAPQLVLIDGDSQEESSFQGFRNNFLKNVETIFLSQSKSFAMKAFRYRASGFILKPIDIPELLSTLKEAVYKINQKVIPSSEVKEILPKKTISPPGNLIGIPTFEGFDFVSIEDIIRCEGMQKCTRIVLKDKDDLISSYNIGEFIKRLEPFEFFSPHKSHLVNLVHLKKYYKEGTIRMLDDSCIPVSKRRKSAFLNRMLISR